MKKFCLILCIGFLACKAVISQQTIYYDSSWSKTDQANAYLRAELTTKADLIHRKLFFVSNGRLHGQGAYKDTVFQEPVGLATYYYENGQLEDSVKYNDDSEKLFGYHYFKNGQLQASYQYDPATEKETVLGFDSTGSSISNFIYEQEAEFKGGPKAWISHIVKNLNPNVPIKKKAPDNTYQVVIRFIVKPDGSLGDINAETAFGFGMETEAIRVIQKSPRWIPAIQFNRPVNAYRRQPITFVVTR